MQSEGYPTGEELEATKAVSGISIGKIFQAAKLRIHIASSRFSYASGATMTERQTIIHNLDTQPGIKLSDIQAELYRRAELSKEATGPTINPELPPSA
jgi:hypothetical protein